MEDSYITKYIPTSINFFLNTGAAFERLIMRNIASYLWLKIKEARDKNKAFAAVLTDLSKAFDWLKHDLFMAKLMVH